jgi:hypothetical protein
MKNYVINMDGAAPDPISSGDTKSWFFHYKWNGVGEEDNEVFFPIEKGVLPDVGEGDVLWFVLDGVMIGCALVIRVMQDYTNDREELWYNTKDCKASNQSMYTKIATGLVDEQTAILFSIALSLEDG